MIINWDIDKNKSLPNDLIKQGKIVFVDVTADWCLTCKVNKIFVLETKKVKDFFKKNNVIILRLDWTKPNENIKKFLKQTNNEQFFQFKSSLFTNTFKLFI